MYTHFETELQVRPDDIDLHQHVHSSKYIDYVLAARWDQMERCYGMSMAAFNEAGLTWYISVAHIEYKRALGLQEWMIVRAGIQEVKARSVIVDFEIRKRDSGKVSASGYFDYVLIDLKTGKATDLPEWLLEKYTI
ncbi:MAG: YbgC/YbaW family acyl-CoA thioester hydrolase [Kiritimatiellia bacterium]|jgi:YbgC/YbaW family acyl-CoA thioester hydrolase